MKKIRLLLVDDVQLFLDLEKSFLDRESFAIDTARSGEEALVKVRTNRPDLVLLDLFMPDINGDAVCREIKSDPDTRRIPVIMTSSETTTGEARKRCLAAGCDGFIAKPLQREPLLAVIEEALNLARRSNPRVSTRLPCQVMISGDSVRSWISTLAVGGAFVEFSPPPDPGQELEMTFSLPQVEASISTRAVVRWQGRPSANSPKGVGVEFLTLDRQDRESIGSYVDSKSRILGRFA
ncbi:MAG: response regulator [bacterium]|nr:MAG: response regulator [bacterium]